jgi:hypothetical protein
MVRYYAARGLQLAGLILTGEAMLVYFGAPADKMDPLLRTASIGGTLCAGYFFNPQRLIGNPE